MLGWLIIISKQVPLPAEMPERAYELARWETGLGGIDWIKRLVKEGKASQTLFGGYPLRFSAAARDVLPLIESGPPPYEGLLRMRDDGPTREGWNGPATIDQAKIRECSPDQQLTIDAWDLS